MITERSSKSSVLNLRAGDWVEVRSEQEILATLDQDGRLENLPFMPEMLQYCGRRLRVFKRADKTCDYIHGWSIRRMKSAVHLEGVRCDGAGHDGCQAGCLIFWKEAWLKRTSHTSNLWPVDVLLRNSAPAANDECCTVGSLEAASRTEYPYGETVYRCQVTDVPKFTSWMSFWDPRQYVRDLRSGNLTSGLESNSKAHRAIELVLAIMRMLQASIIGLFNEVQEKRRGARYPFIEGTADRPPIERLDLQPGELVEVRSREEIMTTLDRSQRNRGLWFDSEMLPYCGGIYRVLRRVNRIIDEKTGKMVTMKNPCIVLDGVVCKSDFHRLCPRAIYPYWRESWLKRASSTVSATHGQEMADLCKRKS